MVTPPRLAATLALMELGGATASALQVGEVGLPLVRSFSPEEYDGGLQVFDAAQGPDGVLYFACPEDHAVLRFDGERWRKTPAGVPVVSLDVDDEGTVWLGSNGDFGFLRGPEFVSLAGDVRAGAATRASFLATRCTPRGVFFLAQELLALWDGQRLSTWPAPVGGGFMDLEALGDDVFVLEGTQGLHVLAEGELIESAALGEARVLFDALHSDGRHLLGAWLGAEGLSWIRTGDVQPTTLAVPEFQRGPTYLSDIVVTQDGALLVSSASGVLIVDPRGEFQAWLDDETGLASSLVYGSLLDREGAVWVCLAHGIARIDPSPASSLFGEELGLVGTPIAFARHEGEAYCATLEGLFRLREETGRARFERLPRVASLPVYDLVPTLHGLLLSTERGLSLLDGERHSLLSAGRPYALERLDGPVLASVLARGRDQEPEQERGEAVLVAGLDGLSILRWGSSGWSLGAPFPVAWSTQDSAADEQGFWLLSEERTLFRLPFDGAFGEPVQVPGEWLGLCSSSSAASPGGLLAWNRERLAFFLGAATQPEPAASVEWTTLHDCTRGARPIVDTHGGLWLLDRRSLRALQGAPLRGLTPDPRAAWTAPFALEGALFDDLDPSVVWLASHAGALRLDLDGLRQAADRQPIVWPLTSEDGDLVPFAMDDTLASGASVRFEVAAAVFDAAGTSYRFRLEGFEHDWSAWAPLALKEYSSLPGGDFVFHVQARKQGQMLGASRLAFTVLSPWHTTWPALVAAVVVFGTLGLVLLRWRSLRLRRENARLGRMVAERTRDLEAQKERVLEHTSELQRVNERLLQESAAREAADHSQREMHQRLEVAERFESLGAVAGGIAHDFNNYLTAIQGYAELALAEDADRGQRREYLENLTTISSQAAELCSGLLSLAGGNSLVPAPVSLSPMVRGMESLLRTSVQDRGELRLELAEDLPAIAGDPNQLRRALVNLVINAAEASHGRRGAIVVRTGSSECNAADLARMQRSGEREPGTYVYVEVEDHGVGLAPESVHRIFDPFFSTKFVGRGLGLSTVFRIASSHGGAIDVRSQVGRGTSMRLLFPVGTAAPLPPSRAAAAEPGAYLVGHVLVVDDDPQVRGLLANFCSRVGLEVSTAGGGREALGLLTASGDRFGAILLDVSMPGMDGLEVLSEIRRLRRDLPVVIVSGNTDHLPTTTLDDATTFLAKPFSLRTLARALGDALALRVRP